MKFVMIPTTAGAASGTEHTDTTHCLTMPMTGTIVSDLSDYISSPYPFVLGMEQMVKWWHRVRVWRLDASSELFGTIIVDLTLDESNFTDETITLGTDGALDWFNAGLWSGTLEYEPDETVRHITFTLRLCAKPLDIPDPTAITPNVPTPYYMTSDITEILPWCEFTMNGDGVDGNAVQGFTNGVNGGVGEEGDGTGSISLGIDGQTMTMITSYISGSEIDDSNASFTLTPVLYWAYANEDTTNPKWDIATGALLT